MWTADLDSIIVVVLVSVRMWGEGVWGKWMIVTFPRQRRPRLFIYLPPKLYGPAQSNTQASSQASTSESSEQKRLAEVYCIRIPGISSVGHLRLRWLNTRGFNNTD
jgi:hypothetical protein